MRSDAALCEVREGVAVSPGRLRGLALLHRAAVRPVDTRGHGHRIDPDGLPGVTVSAMPLY